VRLAHHFDAEILSVDSMQVYRGMDIGTAKPTVLDREGITHHLIDIAEPDEEFTVAEFRRTGRRIMQDSNASVLIITGGSGLHFRALVDPLSFAPTDPSIRSELEKADVEGLVSELVAADDLAGEHVDLLNPRRVIRAVEVLRLTGETPSSRASTAAAENVRRYVAEIEFTAMGVDPGSLLEHRVQQRMEAMQRGGLIDEVISLRNRLGRTARSAVGYREILEAVETDGDIAEAITLAARNTKKLARRQRTWFQRDPRVRWIPWTDDVDDRTRRLLDAYGQAS